MAVGVEVRVKVGSVVGVEVGTGVGIDGTVVLVGTSVEVSVMTSEALQPETNKPRNTKIQIILFIFSSLSVDEKFLTLL
jgi:hypothetical protein